MRKFDAVDLGIIWSRLVSIADEMVSALVRTSFSTMVRESGDYSCMLFDARGQFLSQGTASVPSFTGTGPATLRGMLAAIPSDTLEDGDVLLTNDPWIGTGHVYDVNIVKPIFHRGALVGYALSVSHLADIGGIGYGTGGARCLRGRHLHPAGEAVPARRPEQVCLRAHRSERALPRARGRRHLFERRRLQCRLPVLQRPPRRVRHRGFRTGCRRHLRACPRRHRRVARQGPERRVPRQPAGRGGRRRDGADARGLGRDLEHRLCLRFRRHLAGREPRHQRAAMLHAGLLLFLLQDDRRTEHPQQPGDPGFRHRRGARELHPERATALADRRASHPWPLRRAAGLRSARRGGPGPRAGGQRHDLPGQLPGSLASWADLLLYPVHGGRLWRFRRPRRPPGAAWPLQHDRHPDRDLGGEHRRQLPAQGDPAGQRRSGRAPRRRRAVHRAAQRYRTTGRRDLLRLAHEPSFARVQGRPRRRDPHALR